MLKAFALLLLLILCNFYCLYVRIVNCLFHSFYHLYIIKWFVYQLQMNVQNLPYLMISEFSTVFLQKLLCDWLDISRKLHVIVHNLNTHNIFVFITWRTFPCLYSSTCFFILLIYNISNNIESMCFDEIV